jgi:hypothetical protein
MADLEDTIFKQNVPGRWSSHEPKGADVRHDDGDEDGTHGQQPAVDEDDDGNNGVPKTEEDALFEHARYLAREDVPEPIRRGILAERMRKSKTGVKGVLADYKAHCKMEKAQREAVALQRQAILTRMAEGYKMSAEESALYAAAAPAHDETLLDSDDEDDAEFLEEFRKQRLQEMMQKSNKPTFRELKEVSTADFLEEVETEDKRVVVVVHLYESSVQACVRMNRFLEEMVRTMPEIKFLRMHATSNQIEVDRLTLPILNIYRAGECEAVLAGIAEELGEYFTREDVEWLLESKLQEKGLL